ncbi:MAG: molybdenum cofactor biosynthesis protein MoaB [Proteobacteria bacterium]|nr:molybdenum cofactor biosynthesis protein MoaB [Pseudomonadota bacterium]MBU1388033.1 molybdenum cofactor biosynthesis protein MoaB [Pseudomonadota bacterium]MBU1542096.1 molybdenum cofactor biosynthesis protein MoaB [Pseudomonadota bacterium]MBU2429281.1 molybdenum cofactor biosynthesis protein MoaB [Pseudomonadota bacterium]MBU2482880.1 molybdenum cofactor biosynthesis protein MoaB [Pseudomonadota bacterium]
MSTRLHKKNMPGNLRIAVVSVSTTRKLAEDVSGAWIKKQAKKEKHEVVIHQTVTDDIAAITELTCHITEKICPDIVIMSGGTGISPMDVTIEAVKPLFKKELTAFGPLFTQLSFEQIDSAAILSRATAGIINQSIVFCIPGSLNACKLACNNLIFPEMGHLLKHIKE